MDFFIKGLALMTVLSAYFLFKMSVKNALTTVCYVRNNPINVQPVLTIFLS